MYKEQICDFPLKDKMNKCVSAVNIEGVISLWDNRCRTIKMDKGLIDGFWIVTRCGEGRGNKVGFFKTFKAAFLRDSF